MDGNDENTRFTPPVRTKKLEEIMILLKTEAKSDLFFKELFNVFFALEMSTGNNWSNFQFFAPTFSSVIFIFVFIKFLNLSTFFGRFGD